MTALSPPAGIVERMVVVVVASVSLASGGNSRRGRGRAVARRVVGSSRPGRRWWPAAAALGWPAFGSPVSLATIGRVDGLTCQRNVPAAPTSIDGLEAVVDLLRALVASRS